MRTLIDGLLQAILLITGGDAALFEIVVLSLTVSGVALAFSVVLGVPAGVLLGLTRFRGRRLAISSVYTGMAFPPVVVGLFVYLMLSRVDRLAGWACRLSPRSSRRRP